MTSNATDTPQPAPFDTFEPLEEAALIDGAGRVTAFWRVLLPLAAPGLVASAIFAFTLSLAW